jgi:aminopeptidase N
VRLELRLDPAARAFEATTSLRLRLVRPADSVELDAVELDVRRVEDAEGRELTFEKEPRVLRVRLAAPAEAGAEISLKIGYAAHPRRGLFFVSPSPARRGIPAQAWTSFWPQDARFVIPCNDDPADKATSETLLTVPEGWRAMSNGLLVETRAEPGKRRLFHYKLDKPHSAYLMAFVAGEYDEASGDAAGVPLAYFTYRGRADDARQSLARTPQILATFGERTGLPYPWPKLGLSFVADFVHGAMENVSAITFSDHLLLDPRARQDAADDGTLAHEIAHQWWGDLVTPATWPDLWLSEGFATFFTDVWVEETAGEDAAAWERLKHVDSWTALEKSERERAIVADAGLDPWLVLNQNVYARASLVIAQLRQVMGEDAFWTGLRTFLGRYSDRAASTDDLERTLSLAAGRDLRWFFEQWLRRTGAPQVTAAWSWDQENTRVVIRVTQTQPAFLLPLDVSLVGETGARSERIFVERASQEFSLPADARPLSVELDPAGRLPVAIAADKPVEERRIDLERGTSPVARARAARTLQDLASVPALRRALTDDPFWGVRQEAAAALGRIDADSAELRDARRAGLRDADPRVRAAAATAIATEGPSAGPVLIERLDADPSEKVAAAALRGLGRARADAAWERLVQALGRDSQAEKIRIAALDGLATLGEPRAIPLVLEQTAPGRDVTLRKAAVTALGRLGRGQGVAASRLTKLLKDEDRSVRSAAAQALALWHDPQARGPIAAAAGEEDHPRYKYEMERALGQLDAAR